MIGTNEKKEEIEMISENETAQSVLDNTKKATERELVSMQSYRRYTTYQAVFEITHY